MKMHKSLLVLACSNRILVTQYLQVAVLHDFYTKLVISVTTGPISIILFMSDSPFIKEGYKL